MSVQRKRYSAEEKSKVAIEAIKGQKTLNELAAESRIVPTVDIELPQFFLAIEIELEYTTLKSKLY